MDSQQPKTDYETYREIMADLTKPITADGLDPDTLKRLYESKLVYLDKLRTKCFWELNTTVETHFSHDDHSLIVSATSITKSHLKELVILTITERIARRKSA